MKLFSLICYRWLMTLTFFSNGMNQNWRAIIFGLSQSSLHCSNIMTIDWA